MKITVSKPRGGRVRVVVHHSGTLLRFRRVLEGVDAGDVGGALLPVLEEYERRRDALKGEAFAQNA